MIVFVGILGCVNLVQRDVFFVFFNSAWNLQKTAFARKSAGNYLGLLIYFLLTVVLKVTTKPLSWKFVSLNYVAWLYQKYFVSVHVMRRLSGTTLLAWTTFQIWLRQMAPWNSLLVGPRKKDKEFDWLSTPRSLAAVMKCTRWYP